MKYNSLRTESSDYVSEMRSSLQRNYAIIYYQIIERAGGEHCAYCEKRGSMAIDHIIPLSRGGTNEADNLQLLCRSCNSKKGNRLAGDIIYEHDYTILRIWKKTHKALRLIAALTGGSMIAVLDELASTELGGLQKQQNVG